MCLFIGNLDPVMLISTVEDLYGTQFELKGNIIIRDVNPDVPFLESDDNLIPL